jgi:hypothetical protein
MSRATFEEFENEFPEYFAQLDNKMIQAHEVAFRILGNSYQLEFTIDYQKWIKNQKQNENENQNQKQNENENQKQNENENQKQNENENQNQKQNQPADNNSTENK